MNKIICLCGEIIEYSGDIKPAICVDCWWKAKGVIRKLLTRNKSLKRKVRILKDISGMLQHGIYKKNNPYECL